MLKSPFFEINYGWPYGSDGWNNGMDLNLVRISFLMGHAVEEFVDVLPDTPEEGYRCILNSDNLAYFYVGDGYTFVELEEGYEFTTLTDNKRWKRTPTGYEEVVTTADLLPRVEANEEGVGNLQSVVSDIQDRLDNLDDGVGGIIDDASGLNVTSDGDTQTLADWMEFVRDRSNHTGTQEASSISDFSQAVESAIQSETLTLTSIPAGIRIEDYNSYGDSLSVVGGEIDIASAGGHFLSLEENVSNISLPQGEEGKLLSIQLLILQNTETPFTVEGWPVDVRWVDDTPPEIPSEPDSLSVVNLTNINNSGWVGSIIKSIAPVEEAVDQIQNELGNKVDIEEGKGLSTNDFTDEYIDKISELEDEVNGKVSSVVAGEGVTVDNTDPLNPVISATSSGGGASSFTGLSDTPSTYAGFEGYYVRVNADGTGLEFVREINGGDY